MRPVVESPLIQRVHKRKHDRQQASKERSWRRCANDGTGHIETLGGTEPCSYCRCPADKLNEKWTS